MTGIFTPPHSSWFHRAVRLFVRPMVGGTITPNHLTTARLVSGVVACVGFALGDPVSNIWGGILWILSFFLDRADGELARISDTSSEGGHIYDYYSDLAVNSLFFVAIGVGLRNGDLGGWAIALGLLSGVSIAAASVLSERLEEEFDDGGKAYAGILGFDFDDILVLFAPAAWLGLFPYLLIGASVGGPFFAVLTWLRIWRRPSVPG